MASQEQVWIAALQKFLNSTSALLALVFAFFLTKPATKPFLKNPVLLNCKINMIKSTNLVYSSLIFYICIQLCNQHPSKDTEYSHHFKNTRVPSQPISYQREQLFWVQHRFVSDCRILYFNISISKLHCSTCYICIFAAYFPIFILCTCVQILIAIFVRSNFNYTSLL